MSVIPIIPDASFRAVKAWFSGTDAAKSVDKLELIVVEKNFPNVVNFICDGKSRYFLVSPEIVRNVAKSVFLHVPITPAEGTFLGCIRSQLDGRVQVILDAKSSIVAEKCTSLDGFIRYFEAPCPRGRDLKRFVVELRAPIDSTSPVKSSK
jgi:hypothetical protein